MGRESFRNQMGADAQAGSTDQEKMILAGEIEKAVDDISAGFESKIAPSDMRQLALVAHNHMKPAMKEFIQTYSEILMKFRITGTQTTMRMCKTLWGEDNPEIEYGLTCTSGPLGGDAQIAALMCMEDLGALIFFIDPLSAHPHQADIDSLGRLANCGNIIVCANPTSAMSMMHTLKAALEKGDRGMIPSFFQTLESPAVEEYKRQQNAALQAVVKGKTASEAAAAVQTHDSDSDDSDDEVDDVAEQVESKVKFAGDEEEAPPARTNRSSQLVGIAPKKKHKGWKKMFKGASTSFRKL